MAVKFFFFLRKERNERQRERKEGSFEEEGKKNNQEKNQNAPSFGCRSLALATTASLSERRIDHPRYPEP